MERIAERVEMLTGGPYLQEWNKHFFHAKWADQSAWWKLVPLDQACLAKDLQIGLTAIRQTLTHLRIACVSVERAMHPVEVWSVSPSPSQRS
jgi:hypothetical protein